MFPSAHTASKSHRCREAPCLCVCWQGVLFTWEGMSQPPPSTHPKQAIGEPRPHQAGVSLETGSSSLMTVMASVCRTRGVPCWMAGLSGARLQCSLVSPPGDRKLL